MKKNPNAVSLGKLAKKKNLKRNPNHYKEIGIKGAQKHWSKNLSTVDKSIK